MNFMWERFKGQELNLKGEDGEKIPLILLHPKENRKNQCVILLHGITSSKDGWLEKEGYVSGGVLTLNLLEEGYAVAALDLRKHGKRKDKDYPDFTTHFNDVVDNWDSFYTGSISDIKGVLKFFLGNKEFQYNQFSLLGFSLGGFFIYDLASQIRRDEVKTFIVLANAMITQEGMAGNPLANAPKIKKPILVILGNADDNYPIQNGYKIYDSIKTNHKELVILDCGHQMDLEYIDHVLLWLNKYSNQLSD